jgi:hypothetical protein
MTASATIDRPRSDKDYIAGCRHRCLLVLVSLAKRCLADDIPTEFSLRYLEFFERFEKLTDGWLSAEVVAMVDPICGKGYEIWEETRPLVPQERNRMIDKPEVFSVLAALNPSLLRVIRHRSETFNGERW